LPHQGGSYVTTRGGHCLFVSGGVVIWHISLGSLSWIWGGETEGMEGKRRGRENQCSGRKVNWEMIKGGKKKDEVDIYCFLVLLILAKALAKSSDRPTDRLKGFFNREKCAQNRRQRSILSANAAAGTTFLFDSISPRQRPFRGPFFFLFRRGFLWTAAVVADRLDCVAIVSGCNSIRRAVDGAKMRRLFRRSRWHVGRFTSRIHSPTTLSHNSPVACYYCERRAIITQKLSKRSVQRVASECRDWSANLYGN